MIHTAIELAAAHSCFLKGILHRALLHQYHSYGANCGFIPPRAATAQHTDDLLRLPTRETLVYPSDSRWGCGSVALLWIAYGLDEVGPTVCVTMRVDIVRAHLVETLYKNRALVDVATHDRDDQVGVSCSSSFDDSHPHVPFGTDGRVRLLQLKDPWLPINVFIPVEAVDHESMHVRPLEIGQRLEKVQLHDVLESLTRQPGAVSFEVPW